MQQIRIHRRRARREHRWHEFLPPDPGDPDVVRAKALAVPVIAPAEEHPAVTFPPARRDGIPLTRK